MMEGPSMESAVSGNDQQQQQPNQFPTTMKHQPQQAPEFQVLLQNQPQQQRSSSPFPPLDLSGTTVFEWATPHTTNPFGSPSGTDMMIPPISKTNNTVINHLNNTNNNADPHQSRISALQEHDMATTVTPNSKSFDMVGHAQDNNDPAWTAVSHATLTQSTTPTKYHIPQHHPHHHPQQLERMGSQYQSLFFLQTAAEQETVNKTIELENALMHERLVAMAKKKSSTMLDQEIEEARVQLRQQSLESHEQKRQALAKENAKMQLKLAQVQWRSPNSTQHDRPLAPVVEQRMQDLEQERLAKQQQERQRNEQVDKENARLKLKLAQLQWKPANLSQLDPSVQQRRKDLKEERRKSLEERQRQKQLLAKENARLKRRLSQVTGKVVKKLDPTVEQRRLELVEERRKSLEQLKQAQAAAAALTNNNPRPKTRTKSPTNTTLDQSIVQRRHELEQERRQKAERKRLELRAHTKAMKERICSAKNKETRSLDKATKSKRKELQEKRAKEKFEQEQELRKQNAAMRKRRSQYLQSDEYYDNSPAAAAANNGKRFSFSAKEQRQLQQKRQQQKKQELETHRKEFLKRTRGIKRGRTNLSLDAEVEALRKDLAQKSISSHQERTQKIRKQNVELKQRLSDISGKETKSLSGVVQAIRSQQEESRKQAILKRHRELMQHEKAFQKRLSNVTSRDSTKLKESTLSTRSQRNAKRHTTIRQKQKELAKHKAKLQQMVQNVKSPIQQMLSSSNHHHSSPPFAFGGSLSAANENATTTPSPVSFVSIDTTTKTSHTASVPSPLQVANVQLLDVPISPHDSMTTPKSIIDAAKEAVSSSEKKRLGPKRIVQASQRNQELRNQNVQLRKRLAEATAASIQQLEASITP